VIAFIGSVFSPYYHWSGRKNPLNHVAFNVALYGPRGHAWAMTERGTRHLRRERRALEIGGSSICFDGSELVLAFDEVFLPWPGQRWWPERMQGEIRLTPSILADQAYRLDPSGRHVWQPVVPQGRVTVSSEMLPNGGWSGQGYHDMNYGSRPLEMDFEGWDWARGATEDGRAILVYDAVLADKSRNRFGLLYAEDEVREIELPARQRLVRGFWGVGWGVACDEAADANLCGVYEDSPFYRRSLVKTEIAGERLVMMHETLDCRRLANPLVRLMLPFRMPRRA
jgi:carotenoid 1,2-hydratase